MSNQLSDTSLIGILDLASNAANFQIAAFTWIQKGRKLFIIAVELGKIQLVHLRNLQQQ